MQAVELLTLDVVWLHFGDYYTKIAKFVRVSLPALRRNEEMHRFCRRATSCFGELLVAHRTLQHHCVKAQVKSEAWKPLGRQSLLFPF